jgi:translation initiation factor IF-2
VPIVVAINKMDLPTANAANIKNQLAHHGVIVESFGGKNVAVEISCKTGQNIDKLLEVVAIEAELLELKANPARKAEGTVIESKLDSRLGVVATVLITNGTLHRGDNFVTGPYAGRVKVMTDEFGRRIDEAGPAHPVQVLGLSGTPRAGDSFVVVDNEHMAREISVKRSQVEKEREQRQIKHMSLDELYSQIKLGGVRDVNLIVKGDVDGSVEALSDALQKLSTPTIKINIIHKSVGAIKESDILLAAATNAVIIGFHIYPNSKVRELAVSEGVDIRIYKIIYEAVEEMQKAMEGMLVPVEKEVVLGNAEIRDVFKISKVGSVAGCYVVSGLMRRAAKVRILRDGKPVIETKIASLKRVKDDASEVLKGFECGVFLENYNDIKKGDIIEAFEMQQIQAQK